MKATLLIPKSPLPMKANLPTREPEILEHWGRIGLYDRLREKRKGAPRFLLHDGPPYANGEIHMGHALNKTLKDIIVRFRFLSGFDAPYVPGWDCHGLPIEHNVMKDIGEKPESLSTAEIRRRCRKYAGKFVEIQKKGFLRMGCLGQWDRPYLTMDRGFESRILEAFSELHKRGCIYRGQKPIHWCPNCRTALAASTAEAEYADHVSDTVIVAFKAVAGADEMLIWTTTPWTLPANVAMAVRPDLVYVTVKVGNRRFVLAESLLERTAEACGWSEHEVVLRKSGADWAGTKFRHPFIDRDVVVITADFVTTDQGTGVVHIAPGHGHDDYVAGQANGLPVIAPVDDAGRFTAEAGVCAGRFVFEANGEIIEILKSRGALLCTAKLKHSYPHCWRCKSPIIFRATRQWFLSIDFPMPTKSGDAPMRQLALEAAEAVRWIPGWGRDRFVGTVRERPDWCLSRQRSWGVPIPALVCEACGEGVIDEMIVSVALLLAENARLDDWFDDANRHAENRSCPRCSGRMRRETDILDVWFDSGVSWFATDMIDGGTRESGAGRESRLEIADLYLEGSDQHRGWFQSSLWPSLAIRSVPPYRAVLTHGFMLDGEGRAMHKSAGNVISPLEIMKKYGSDIIRLWVASENFRDDVHLSHGILEQVAESYRKIRNTWRFLLGNIIDLPVDLDVAVADRPPIDRWAMARLADFERLARRAYEEYSFHEIYRGAVEFMNVDMSSFYLDILKDRLYCDAAGSPSRRAAQVTCRDILAATLKIMAPILCFSTDEVWALTPLKKNGFEADSIHLADWPNVPEPAADALSRFESLLDARGEILKALEEKRAAGEITTSQMALVRHPYNGDDRELLREICQVSEIVEAPAVEAAVTSHPKCPRCWRYLPLETNVCARCRAVIERADVPAE